MKFSTNGIKVLCLAIVLMAWPLVAVSQEHHREYRVIENYGCTVYKHHITPNVHYEPDIFDKLSNLRSYVHASVANNNPRAAIEALLQITSLDPADFNAFEFLSYSYAVLGEPVSAANVDVDIIARFDFIAPAEFVVLNASRRLSVWDPPGWQQHVSQRKAELGL